MSKAPALPADAPYVADALAAAMTPATYLDSAHRAVMHAATLAPSVHDSQPWTFHQGRRRAGPVPRRRPPASRPGPEGRLVHLSCGAALQNAQVAARALGFLARPELLDGDRQQLVGRLPVRGGRAVCLRRSRATGRSQHGAGSPAPAGLLTAGLAEMQSGDTVQTLVERADAHLYDRRRRG